MNDVTLTSAGYHAIISNICALGWARLDRADISAVALGYYYFSIQFRENLEIAHRLYPHDVAVRRLIEEECDTDNLSPWPGVAQAGEKLNHDEFVRRVLLLSPIDPKRQRQVEKAGHHYLSKIRAEDEHTRALSIASYEDGGLERVFKAILQCQCWDTPLLEGFRHFLLKHISFDSNPDEGHGALVRHLVPNERVCRLWDELHKLFIIAAPRLADMEEYVS
jgi:hypothetical protein